MTLTEEHVKLSLKNIRLKIELCQIMDIKYLYLMDETYIFLLQQKHNDRKVLSNVI